MTTSRIGNLPTASIGSILPESVPTSPVNGTQSVAPEPVKITVPRARTRSDLGSETISDVQSLAEAIKADKSAASAHGLDATRVADLLSED